MTLPIGLVSPTQYPLAYNKIRKITELAAEARRQDVGVLLKIS